MIRSSLVKSVTAFIVLALLSVNISSKDVNAGSYPQVSAAADAASHFTGSQPQHNLSNSSPRTKTQAAYLHLNKKIHRMLGGEDDGHHHDATKPWGEVLGSCFLVNIVTLSGVLFFTKSCSKESLTKKPEATVHNTFAKFAIPSFAAGALFATTLFLILPESFSHVQVGLSKGGGYEGEEDHEGEIPVDVAWRVGMCILIGFLVPAILNIFTGRHDHDENGLVQVHQEEEEENNADDEEALTENEQEEQNSIDWGLAGSLIIGDFLHNFGDGIFIGAAFFGCSKSLAWTIVGITVYHEIAQEISDLLLLTRFAGFSLLQAIVVNFLSGTSVIIGGLIILAIDVGDVALGVIFAISSGIYLQIALAECSPRANANMNTTKERLLGLLMFTIGVVPIGLTLLNHNHCEAGHDHR